MSDTVDQNRLEKAYRISQHDKVARFHNSTRLVAAVSGRAVVHTPVAQPPSRISTPKQPQPITASAPKPDIFAKALQVANSHQSPAPATNRAKKSRKRIGKAIMASSIVAALIATVGVVVYLNRTNIEVQIAAAQAGFAVTQPAYVPDGYKYQSISYQPGQISLNYHAVSTQDSYRVIQQPSAWNSQTLLETFVKPNQPSYSTEQLGGRTIYLFEAGATWVSGGVWYQLDATESQLTDSQLLEIVRNT